MKKIFYLFALAVLFTTACSKDDATPKYIDSGLLGTWELEYYYRDDNNNPINIDKATEYSEFAKAYHIVTFRTDTACGFEQKYFGTDITDSYYISKNKIKTTKNCEFISSAYLFDYWIGNNINPDITYKIKNNMLIIASNSYSYFTENDCVFYGFYKRKE